jgi:hypothetical protein
MLPPNVKVHLALGFIDMRKGINGLAMLVQGVLQQDPSPATWARTPAINCVISDHIKLARVNRSLARAPLETRGSSR